MGLKQGIDLETMISGDEKLPSPIESQVILARSQGIPKVCFWLENGWETEAGERPVFESWIYLYN